MGFANQLFLVGGGPTSYLNKIGIYFQCHQQDVSLPCDVVFNGDGTVDYDKNSPASRRFPQGLYSNCNIIYIYIYTHTYIV